MQAPLNNRLDKQSLPRKTWQIMPKYRYNNNFIIPRTIIANRQVLSLLFKNIIFKS